MNEQTENVEAQEGAVEQELQEVATDTYPAAIPAGDVADSDVEQELQEIATDAHSAAISGLGM